MKGSWYEGVNLVVDGTNPDNKYEVKYYNDKGFVGVKRDNKYGSDSETRVRCCTWKVQETGLKTVGDDYDFLVDKGWEPKPNNHHVSIHIDTNTDSEITKRVEEAIVFLNL